MPLRRRCTILVKIAIDAKILNKPGKLTPEEFEQMKQHTILGAKMLDDLAAHHNEKLVRTACDICRWHRERYDPGGGYPDGLVGERNPDFGAGRPAGGCVRYAHQ